MNNTGLLMFLLSEAHWLCLCRK